MQPEILLAPIRPNLGVEAAYRKSLKKLLREMRADVQGLLERHYPKGIAQDGLSDGLQAALSALLRYWAARLDKLAPQIAEIFADQSANHTERAFQTALREAGFTVRFRATARQQTALQAVLGGNVSLIRSIGRQYLDRVEESVWRSVNAGYDMAQLTRELRKDYGISERRAAFIARDQTNKAKAAIEKARRQELGITEAIWMHSHAGKEPRPSHVAADGKRFDVGKGMYLDGKWVQPGEEINCFPGDSVIQHFDGVKQLWRRFYCGKLTKLITQSGEIIKATPNHPILTNRGWVAIKDIHIGDYVVKVGSKVFNGFEDDIERNNPTFAQLFDAAAFLIGSSIGSGAAFKFHGDISYGEVDIINIERFLPYEINPALLEKVFKLFLADAGHILVGLEQNSVSPFASAIDILFAPAQSNIRSFGALLALLRGHFPHADDICFRLSSYMHSAIEKAVANSPSRDIEALRKLKFANTGFIQRNEQIIGEVVAIIGRLSSCFRDIQSPSADMLGQSVLAHTNLHGGVLEHHAIGEYQFDGVVNKSICDFSGHVYNLENKKNWYSNYTIISHNCRCTSRSVIKGFNA